MFLKHRKGLCWLCCLLGAVCLALGITPCIDSDGKAGDSQEIRETRALEFGEWETQAATERQTQETRDETVMATTEGAIKATVWGPMEGSTDESVTGTVWSSENVPAGPAESEPADADEAISFEQLLYMASPVLLILGSIFAALFVFLYRQNRALAGPETELLLIFLCMLLIFRSMDAVLLLRIAARGLLLGVALICVRGFFSWFMHRCSLDWSAGHQLGMLVVRLTKRQSGYVLFQLFLCMAAICGVIFCLLPGRDSYLWYILSAICGFAFLLSVCCWIRLTRALDHLAEQIGRLHEGQAVTVHPGTFAALETWLGDLQQQRDAAVHTAVTSERFKVELISNVSHDLRTPLTAILGYGELLKHEAMSPEGRRQLEQLNRKAGYMRDLVEDLFELTKVSSGVLESKREPLDLIRLLEQTLGLYEDQLAAANLQVRRHYENESLMILSDGARLHQVFANLIGNAIKYTLAGTRIHLEVKTDGHECTVRVMNVASYEMDFDPSEITQRFTRGDKARSTMGSGLGLAIAQTYTASVGGTFGVSVDGDQFSAMVTLPLPDRET